MSLPTFSELMASLNLSNTGEPETGAEGQSSNPQLSSPSPSPPPTSYRGSRSVSPTATRQHPPSNIESPSIIVSEFDSSHSTHQNESRGARSLGRSNRFSPYLAAANNLHFRRRSLPDVTEASKQQPPDRASTISPPIHPNTLRDVSMNAARPTRTRKAMHVDIGAQSDVPISSFVRRHTPQSSPTTSTFHHRKRSGSFSPVLLPTLLPGLPGSSPPHHSPEMTSLSEVVNTRLSPPPDSPRPRIRQQGLRVSSYRPASYSSERRSIPLQSAI